MHGRILLALFVLICSAPFEAAVPDTPATYLLGPEDLIVVHVVDVEEFEPTKLGAVPVDAAGNVRLPIVGRVPAAGLTAEQLSAELSRRLQQYVQKPDVSVVVSQAKSHPVSVVGAVKNPGVYQITGKQTLYQVLSLAGGLVPESGNTVKITRRVSDGELPLPNARRDSTGKFSVGELNLREVMQASKPSENIDVLSGDIVSVPRAELVYIVGAVKKPGGFTLSEREQMSVLQALSLAEGLDRLAAAKNARILHQSSLGGERTETAINLERILTGQAKDVSLLANDVLFIPTSMAKNAGMRGLETAIQLATGVVIFRR